MWKVYLGTVKSADTGQLQGGNVAHQPRPHTVVDRPRSPGSLQAHHNQGPAQVTLSARRQAPWRQAAGTSALALSAPTTDMATTANTHVTEPRAIDHSHPHRRLPRFHRSNRAHRVSRRLCDHALLLPHIHQARAARRLPPHHIHPVLLLPHQPRLLVDSRTPHLTHPLVPPVRHCKRCR